jgi:hypothetical protein
VTFKASIAVSFGLGLSGFASVITCAIKAVLMFKQIFESVLVVGMAFARSPGWYPSPFESQDQSREMIIPPSNAWEVRFLPSVLASNAENDCLRHYFIRQLQF